MVDYNTKFKSNKSAFKLLNTFSIKQQTFSTKYLNSFKIEDDESQSVYSMQWIKFSDVYLHSLYQEQISSDTQTYGLIGQGFARVIFEIPIEWPKSDMEVSNGYLHFTEPLSCNLVQIIQKRFEEGNYYNTQELVSIYSHLIITIKQIHENNIQHASLILSSLYYSLKSGLPVIADFMISKYVQNQLLKIQNENLKEQGYTVFQVQKYTCEQYQKADIQSLARIFISFLTLTDYTEQQEDIGEIRYITNEELKSILQSNPMQLICKNTDLIIIVENMLDGYTNLDDVLKCLSNISITQIPNESHIIAQIYLDFNKKLANDVELSVQQLINFAQIYIVFNRITHSQSVIQQIDYIILNQLKYDHELFAQVLELKALIANLQDQPNQIFRNLEASMKIREQKNDNFQLAIMNQNLGKVYIGVENFELGKKHIKIAKEMFEQLFGQSSKYYLHILKDLAVSLEQEGEFQRSYQIYNEALQICQIIYHKLHTEQIQIFHKLGQLSNLLNHPHQALQYFISARKIAENNLADNKNLIYPDILYGEAYTLCKLNKYKESWEKVYLALEVRQDMRAQDSKLADICLLCGKVIIIWKHDIQQSEKYFFQSLEIISVLNNRQYYCDDYKVYLYLIGDAYEEAGEFQKASEYYKKSIIIQQTMGKVQSQQDKEDIEFNNIILNDHANVLLELGDYNSANSAYYKIQQYNEQTYGQESIQYILILIKLVKAELGKYNYDQTVYLLKKIHQLIPKVQLQKMNLLEIYCLEKDCLIERRKVEDFPQIKLLNQTINRLKEEINKETNTKIRLQHSKLINDYNHLDSSIIQAYENQPEYDSENEEIPELIQSQLVFATI